MGIFTKKPKIWLVKDQTENIVQEKALASYLTTEKNIIEHDKLHAHTEGKNFPDLAIGTGFDTVDTLKGIKLRSKGKTKTAIILDPLKDYDKFDYIILPSYEPYNIEHDNIIWTKGLLNYVNPEFLEKKEKEYKKDRKYAFYRLHADFEGPYTAVLIGGLHTGGNISVDDAKIIAEKVNEIVNARGGMALITTSHRTEFETTKTLLANIKVKNFFYDYKMRETENPYDIFLSLADEVIVTGESVRMLSESCSSEKRVRIYNPLELGFQYEPLIEELINSNHAVDLLNGPDFFENTPLNEAKRVAEVIKKTL